MISLGGGMPNPTTFPYKSIQVEAKDGTKFALEGSELSKALQYCETAGSVYVAAQRRPSRHEHFSL